jgi:hypothetical protein
MFGNTPSGSSSMDLFNHLAPKLNSESNLNNPQFKLQVLIFNENPARVKRKNPQEGCTRVALIG